MPEFASVAEMMEQLSAQAVEIARDFAVELDFSAASVTELEEQLLDQLSAGVRSGESKPSDDEMAMMAKLWGAYLGETVRREFGGEWRLERPMGAQAPSAALLVRGATIFPTVKVFRRITMGEQENIAHFYGNVVERLRKTPPPS